LFPGSIELDSSIARWVDGFAEELDVFVEGFFEDALLVAVRAEALRRIFLISHCADTVALDSFGPQNAMSRCARAHRRQRWHAVDLLNRRLKSVATGSIDARRGARRAVDFC
jgi:hypothetical protein